jgi:outer membrane protein TolC
MLRREMRPWFFLVAITVGSGLSFGEPSRADAAAEPEAITLKEALVRAARGNVDLRRQNIAIVTSRANLLAAEGQFDFVVGGDASYTKTVNPPLHVNDVTAGSTKTGIADLSLTRALETGGQLQLLAQGRTFTSSSAITCGNGSAAAQMAMGVTCNVYQPTLSLNFTQPLLRGFGREITEANLRKQRINADLALLNRQAHASNDIRDTIIAYWELAYQAQDLAIRHAAEDLARDQLRITEAQIKIGKLGELSAAAVKRAIAQAQADVATSQQQLTGRALDLERLFGAPVPRGFSGIVAADAPTATPHDIDVEAETDHALTASPALRSLRQGLALSEIDVKVAQASLRPQLDLNATLGRVGRNTNILESARQLWYEDDTVYTAGLTFSAPVQNRQAKGAAEAATAAGNSARLDVEDLELSIRDGVARDAAIIHSAGERLGFAGEAVRYAEDNLKAEMARFQVGTSTNNDVLLRQQELRQAQISVARATADLLEAEVALEALTGDLLETYGITLR